MSTTSTSPAEAAAPQGAASRSHREALIWDAPVRVFHWLMVLAFAGAWLTSESEAWRPVHVTLGYTMGGLVVFRLVWGVTGTRWARFSSFVRGPRAVLNYASGLVRGRAPRHIGHNPAGALAILLLLGMTLLVAATGWAVLEDIGGDWLEEAHEAVATAMLFVVGVHVAGVALGSWLHRENLVKSMITGRKAADEGEAVASARAAIGAILLGAVLAFWWIEWHAAPATATPERAAATGPGHHDADD
jgi:cytochrome b